MAEFNDGMAETRPPQAATVTTDVLIVGSGPAGASAALFLSTLGVDNIMVTKYRWTANTPRAHITNQRTMEIFRDMGIEDQVLADATPHALDRRHRVLHRHRRRGDRPHPHAGAPGPTGKADYQLASPCLDLSTSRRPTWSRSWFATRQCAAPRPGSPPSTWRTDRTPTASTCEVLDRLSGHRYTIRAKYLIGADGARSKIAADIGLPFAGRHGHRRIDEHHLQGRHRPLRRPSPVGAVLGAAAGLQRRRDRGRPGAHGAAVE